MLPKSARLTRAEFSTVFTQPGKKVHVPECSVYYAPSPSFKASVVVGKKVAKSAVLRNKLRREVYPQLQSILQDSVLSGQYIFILKPPYTKLSKTRQRTIITDLLAQNLKSR